MVMSISSVSTERGGRILPRRTIKKPGPDSPYRLHDFLDDQRLLSSSTEPVAWLQTHCTQGLDGGMLVISLASLLEAARARSRTASTFSRKYGPRLGANRLSRFRLVLEFLRDSHAEIADSGLANPGEPMMIQEEFVRFLLNWKVGPAQRRISKSALRRFLDEWGHRWI